MIGQLTYSARVVRSEGACWQVSQRRRPTMTETNSTACVVRPAGGRSLAQKPSWRPGHVGAIRAKLDLEKRTRDLAMFNLAIDSKLRGFDLVALRVDDVAPNGYAIDRADVSQRK